ncbi:type II secretion system F family protein [Vulcanisaeta thermophila]|uniref:type II secretion system F family protein n=1 Tax=Vulcanisaeta thermophila TaxID=867917 RepID=UPI0008534812|nr:type II secretion system F family protein [Vulcanisaeta thermophila]
MDLDELALSVMGPLVLRLRGTGLYRRLEQSLRASLSFQSPERYMARTLFITLVTLAITAPLGVILIMLNLQPMLILLRMRLLFTTPYGIRDLVMVILGLVLIVIPAIIYEMMINMPRITASDLAFRVDTELPFFVAYVSAITNSGLSVFRAVERMATARILEVMGKISRWAFIRFRVFGEDPLTALSNVTSSIQSRALREFIGGYITTVRTGGDVVHYINTRLHDIMADAIERMNRAAEYLGMLMESYIGSAAILLIGLDVMYLAQAVTPFGNRYAAFMQAINSNYIFGLFVVPGISVAFIYLGEISAFRSPYTDYRPYKWAAVSMAVAAALGFMEYAFLFHRDLSTRLYIRGFPIPLDFTVLFGLTLALSFLPTAIYSMRVVGERWEIDREYAEFLRDATELRKSGFTPEKIFETLRYTRSYGAFDYYLDRIVRQIRYGVPIREVLNSIMPRLHSYYSRVFTFLLTETIDLGGASPQVLDLLANFASSLVSVQESMRARLRALRYVPYIGAIILIVTLVILIFSVVAIVVRIGPMGFASTSPTQNPLVNLLSTSFSLTVVIDSFIMGLIAGKLGEGELSLGFRHAVILTLMVVAVYAVSPFIANALFGAMSMPTGGLP